MKVGLDGGPLENLLQIRGDPLQLLDMAIEHGFEGLAFSARALLQDEAYRRQVIEKAQAHNLYLELGGARIDTALSGKSTSELVEDWKPLFAIASEAESPVLITGLGTWPWEGRVIKEDGRTLSDQIQGGIATLRELSSIAADWKVTVAIHTGFMTAREYVQIMEAVDSPYVGLCLDTANSFLILEDPVDFARQVMPYVRATHFKDSIIHLQQEGIRWLGGSLLGRGTVDLPTIAEMLYHANPQCNLTIEDARAHRGIRPMYAPEFLDTLSGWDGERLSKILRHLWRGQMQVQSGVQLTGAEAEEVDWTKALPERQRWNAAYAKQLRDRTEAR